MIAETAKALGFTGSVVTRRNKHDEAGTLRPARGEGPLVLALLHSEYRPRHAWESDPPILWLHVSVTHVVSGLGVTSHFNPLTPAAPRSVWLIPATEAGVAIAEDMRTRLLALGLPWERTPRQADAQAWANLINTINPPFKEAVAAEREAARLFKVELLEREWHLNKTATAEAVRDAMHARFPWKARRRKKRA